MNKIISKQARHFTQDNTSVILSLSESASESSMIHCKGHSIAQQVILMVSH